MNYINRETNEYNADGYACELAADNRLVKTGNYTEIYRYVREEMLPGDTYTEKYDSTGTESGTLSFGDMVLEWELKDVFTAGDPEYDTLALNNKARRTALKMAAGTS